MFQKLLLQGGHVLPSVPFPPARGKWRPELVQPAGTDLCLNHIKQLFIGAQETTLGPGLSLSCSLNL